MKKGKEYIYWEARVTVGADPMTGKQRQRSITGKTQQEVAQKLRQLTAEIDNGTYREPSKMTVGEWLNTWQEQYLNDLKPLTREMYVTAVLDILHRQRMDQEIWKCIAGKDWLNNGLVFTDELGGNLTPETVYKNFKKVAVEIGCENLHFHSLRHSYAVAALQSGDDIKTVQENLGHYTAAFTLDVYGHVTDKMRQDSANRMQQYIDILHDE